MSTTEDNSLFSGGSRNYNLLSSAVPGFGISFPTSYSNCSCATSVSSVSCRFETLIFDTLRNIIVFIVPGFYSGCYTIESLLVSSLQCFHDQHCLDNLTHYVNSTREMNVTALDATLSSKFTANSTVGEMIDELMVEEWNSSIAFAKYYDECEPSECTYTVESKNEAMSIVTTVIGLIGGLVKVLKLIVPKIVNLFKRFF